MENKINVAELLKDCPNGMELNCVMNENVYFDKICDDEDCIYPIRCCMIEDGVRTSINFTKYGEFNTIGTAKCVIFPKGKTTWEGFHRHFKDGDILYCNANDDGDDDNSYKYVFILREIIENKVIAHCFITGEQFVPSNTFLVENSYPIRFASEEEKERLFQAIKDNGYKWNEETKTLEKLVEPKFKVGDIIKHKCFGNKRIIISYGKNEYWTSLEECIDYENQDEWELVPNKFDITTLVPFESRVLIRDHESQKWRPAIWGVYDDDKYFPYRLIGTISHCCIPYEGNEHLLNTTNGCDEYYKTWE